MDTSKTHAASRRVGPERDRLPGPEILDWLRDRQGELLDVLRGLTGARSPSQPPESGPSVAALIAGRLETLGYRVRRTPACERGDMLVAVPRQRRRGQPPQLVLGHLDSRLPWGPDVRTPSRADGSTLRAMGGQDPQESLVIAILALGALRDFRVEPPLTPALCFDSIEANGRGERDSHIRRLVRCAERVVMLDRPFRPIDGIRTTRRGVGRFTVHITGEGTPAGPDPGRGAGAVLELSHVMQALFALNDRQRGSTVSVGAVDGGRRLDAVARSKAATAHVCVAAAGDGERIERAIRGIRPMVPGIRIDVEGGFDRPAMAQATRDHAAWDLALCPGRSPGLDPDPDSDLDFDLDFDRGGGDAARHFIATCEDRGAAPDGARAPHGQADVERILERAALLSMLLMAAPLGRAAPPRGRSGDPP